MKKIMFNDKYGLTKAVLEGRKTQTRRIVTYPKTFHGKDVCGFYVCKRVSDGVVTDVCMYDENESFIDEGQILPKYNIGEVVAIAQSYHTIYDEFGLETMDMLVTKLKDSKGWGNKMFVKAELMPHQIRITNVRIERIQDISDEDCLKEGIEFDGKARQFYCVFNKSTNSKIWIGSTPREAYEALIDKVSGKGTWEINPYVFVYDFELIK